MPSSPWMVGDCGLALERQRAPARLGAQRLRAAPTYFAFLRK